MSLHFYLLGIGGIGMSALAGLLKARGFQVSGSEGAPPSPPASQVLKRLGLIPFCGWDPERLEKISPDYVVVGNAIRRDHPEVEAARRQGLPLLSLPETLKRFILPGKLPLVVAGTHGKTTTSALLAFVLERLGQEPTFFLGGLLRDRELNFGSGEGPYAVVEGDEYDSAFFEKTPKFWHYRAFSAILTSLEYDHADIYPDLASLEAAFRTFVELLPEEGLLVFWGDADRLVRLAERSRARRVSYGRSPKNTYRLLERTPFPRGQKVRFCGPQGEGTFDLPLYGEHNALNALAVLALLVELGLSPEEVARALGEFCGVLRRQEILYQGRVTVVDDFAHHPTAVRETLLALKEAFSPRRIFLIFEPRTNTSRRRVFLSAYQEVLSLAEAVVLKPPPGLEKVPEAERLDLTALARGLEARGRRVGFLQNGVSDILALEPSPGDLLVFMSSASFGKIYTDLVKALKERGL
ncbi:hypothetical protein FVE67_05725 [Thermosulfurimonas marina]|uniref:UDP-N-acetylmuramate--L-alanine ligase n=1 Tax=Thermosulfurimonas marina TaxID=2047767 RepID=A0A6H1WSY5_9BACT|nr:Mur ligase family protein [Thermosulfurimonas marina]QJA06335.1 hypothetical protein FVE67_05725 [Thermosulfurimonas marina]